MRRRTCRQLVTGSTAIRGCRGSPACLDQAAEVASMTTKWSPSTASSPASGARGGGSGDVRLGLADRHGVVAAAVDAPNGYVERRPGGAGRPGRRSGPAGGRGTPRRRRRRGRPWCAARRSSTPAWDTTPVTRTPPAPPLEAAAGRRPGREVAAGGVAERDHRRGVQAVDVGERVDPGGDVVEGRGRRRRRCRPGGTPG